MPRRPSSLQQCPCCTIVRLFAHSSAILRCRTPRCPLCTQRTRHGAWILIACAAACTPQRTLPAHMRTWIQMQYAGRHKLHCILRLCMGKSGGRVDALSDGIHDTATANTDDVRARRSCVSAVPSVTAHVERWRWYLIQEGCGDREWSPGEH